MAKSWQFSSAVYYGLHCTAIFVYNTKPIIFPELQEQKYSTFAHLTHVGT